MISQATPSERFANPQPTEASYETRKHILVAEDDQELRRLLVLDLVRDGHDVSAVADGGQLLDYLRAVELEGMELLPDVIVSDVRMPCWKGTDAVELLEALQWKVPIILISAFADESLLRFGRDKGIEVLSKPFDLDLLRALVLDACAARPFEV